MNHSEEKQCDPSNKSQETVSFLGFIEDPKRSEPLIGLQYVVNFKMLDSDNSFVKCTLCDVKGKMWNMKHHLIGVNHIKLYLRKHYSTLYQSLKRKQTLSKAEHGMLLKDYAKEIEASEGKRSIKTEYVSAAVMAKEQGARMVEHEDGVEFHDEQNKIYDNSLPSSWRSDGSSERSTVSQGGERVDAKNPNNDNKSQVPDKRQMALNYSENFKISSRAEATLVLNLTQRLSDQLEKYIFKYDGLNILDSTIPDSISAKSIPESTNFPSNIHEGLHPKSTANQDMKSGAKEMQWHTEDTSSSVGAYPFSMPIEFKDSKGLKRKPEVSEDASYKFNVPIDLKSASECQSRKKSNYQEHYDFPTMHSSSFSNLNVTVSSPPNSAEVSSSLSSSIADTYTKSVPKEKSRVFETLGGQMEMVKNTPQNSVFQNILHDHMAKFKPIPEVKSLNSTDASETSASADQNTTVPEPSCSTSSSSFEPSSEKPSSSKTQGKTSNALSPDILQLLKGKDAGTVKNILWTLSPFYPALQDVNLEILAQVLVNTGALD